MKALRLALLFILLAGFALQVGAARAQAQLACPSSAGYYVASLNADIDPGTAAFMTTTVSNAEAACAGHLVFILTTDGGDGASMQSMVSSIGSYQSWGGNFTTLIAPSTAYSFSAGAYIAEASTSIYMTPGTTIGSATPIVSGIPTGEENSTMTKDINAFASYMETLTSSNGRNATAAGLMVTGGVSYIDSLALKEHVINGVLSADTVQQALTELGVPASATVNSEGISPQLISILSDPNVSSLLFLVGILAVMIDIFHPTIVLSVVGIAVMALALFGLGVFGASLVAIALMLVGAAFVFLEVKTQHGISATIGVAVFAVGFFLVFDLPPAAGNSQLPGATFSGISDVSYVLLAVIGAAIILGSLYLVRVRHTLLSIPKHFDPKLMIGKVGKLESELRAGGTGVAVIDSEEWSVTASEAIPKGSIVKVKEISGVHLTVERSEP